MPTLAEHRDADIARLRAAIHAGVVTERKLARIASVSQSQVHHILSGKRRASIETLDKLTDALQRIQHASSSPHAGAQCLS